MVSECSDYNNICNTHTQHNVILGKVPVIAVCSVGRHEVSNILLSFIQGLMKIINIQVTTQVHYENGTTVWLIAALLCFFFGPLIAWIPFLIDDLKDVVHTCPIDGTVIGVHKNDTF